MNPLSPRHLPSHQHSPDPNSHQCTCGLHRVQYGAGSSRSSSSSSSAAAAATGNPAATIFTPSMRDRQSRGKDPYGSGSDTSDTPERDARIASKMRLGRPPRDEKEDFGALERREKAAAFLDSPELLMMYAQSTGDSIPAARLHFMKLMCGYDDDSLLEDVHRRAHARPPRDTDKRRGGDRAAGR